MALGYWSIEESKKGFTVKLHNADTYKNCLFPGSQMAESRNYKKYLSFNNQIGR